MDKEVLWLILLGQVILFFPSDILSRGVLSILTSSLMLMKYVYDSVLSFLLCIHMHQSNFSIGLEVLLSMTM